MITSRRTLELLCAMGFLVAGADFLARPAQAGQRNVAKKGVNRSPEQYANERISIKHARRATVRPTLETPRRQSMVARAATGRLVRGAAEAPLHGSLVQPHVKQAGYLETHPTSCGPICDCGHCGVEPVCGIDEAGCGFEVGCGIGAAIDRMRSCCDGTGCSECCETACGIEEVYVDGPLCGMEPDCSCDACCDSYVEHIPLRLPLVRFNWCRWDFFAGVQGFTGPLNYVGTSVTDSNLRSGSGSFGFYQGFNRGHSLKRFLRCDLASQIGLRATQSNLSGAGFTRDNRYQVFLTTGLFRKVDYGLQYGLVFDYFNQDWYFQSDAIQLRGELSWRSGGCHVYGFRFMAGLRKETKATVVRDFNGGFITSLTVLEPTDQYRFFYRRLLGCGGECNAFAGWTDRSDGLLGANLSLPLHRKCLLATGFTYLIPNQGSAFGGNEEEGWNISLGLVFRPGGPQGCGRYCRPMFDVADNGSFMIDRL